MSFIPDPNILKELKKLVCQAIGRQMDCASDFTILYDWVEKKTHKSLGTNTLKRLWEYGGEVMRVPQKATCDILAQSIGFRDFEDFQQFKATEDDISSSNVVLTKHLDTKDLSIGALVTLTWQPLRRCLVEYIGNNTFRVLDREKTKLKIGDTFQTTCFAEGQPLMLYNLVQNSHAVGLYIIDRKNGLSTVTVE
ncbi:MAG: hypothetical protein IKU03_09605 [Bacteroidales bacterium]|nr:hypothetical protein [Bacteroidales bacterium]